MVGPGEDAGYLVGGEPAIGGEAAGQFAQACFDHTRLQRSKPCDAAEGLLSELLQIALVAEGLDRLVQPLQCLQFIPSDVFFLYDGRPWLAISWSWVTIATLDSVAVAAWASD